jgi:hypothetical protein
MKTRTLQFVFLSALSCLSFTTRAQITITAADVSAQLTVGYVLTNNSDTLAVSANIGSPGATSWNFNGLSTHTTQSLTSVLVSSTPYTADFPGATHALQTSIVISGVSGIAYQYLTLGTHLLNPGNKAGGTLPPPFSFPATLTTTNAPLDTTYALPSTFGSSWHSAYTSTQVFAINGAPVQTTVTPHNISYTVDAYGLLTLPGGGVQDALRIRKVENAGTKTVSYIILAKNGGSVQLTALDTLQPNTGVIQVQAKSVTWSPANPALPVQISSLSAAFNQSGTRVLLRWTTLSEVNNLGFEVQSGTSQSGEFHTIAGGFVPGHGTTLTPQQYSWTDMSASSGACWYRLIQRDLDGSSHPTEAIRATVPTSVRENQVPAEFSLIQNYPNPFNPSTTIRYGLAREVDVTLEVFNTLGQRVAVLVNEKQAAGYHEAQFNASGLASGAYFYTIKAGAYFATRSLVVLK